MRWPYEGDGDEERKEDGSGVMVMRAVMTSLNILWYTGDQFLTPKLE